MPERARARFFFTAARLVREGGGFMSRLQVHHHPATARPWLHRYLWRNRGEIVVNLNYSISSLTLVSSLAAFTRSSVRIA